MSDETPKKAAKAAKKELTIEEKVELELKKEYEAAELDIVKRKKRRELQNEKNKILVQKAYQAGLDNAPAIGKEISMSENGVRKYAAELGLELRQTDAEKRRAVQDAQRALAEDAERMKFGLKG